MLKITKAKCSPLYELNLIVDSFYHTTGCALWNDQIAYARIVPTLQSEEPERFFPRGITNAGTLGVYDFLDAILSNREPEVTGWDGFSAQAICEAIYESAYCGQAVKVYDVISGKIGAYQEDINKHWNL